MKIQTIADMIAPLVMGTSVILAVGLVNSIPSCYEQKAGPERVVSIDKPQPSPNYINLQYVSKYAAGCKDDSLRSFLYNK